MIVSDINPPAYFDSRRLSHAYIADESLAGIIAMSAVCSGSGEKPCLNCINCGKVLRGVHPDIIVVRKLKNKREIVIDQIRELKRDVIVVPNESDKKVYIIYDADLMNINAQNALLRILEEPPSHTVFILTTDTPAGLLTTVRSRCVELKIKTMDEPPDVTVADVVDEFLSALIHGNAPLTSFMFRLEKLDKEQFSEFLSAARRSIATELRSVTCSAGERRTKRGEILSRAERALAQAGEYLEFNVSAGHISGMICAKLINC